MNTWRHPVRAGFGQLLVRIAGHLALFSLVGLVVSGAFAQSNTCNSLPSGLVAYYPFSGNANDETGSGNDGTTANATLAEDVAGNWNSAFSFAGDAVIACGNGPAFQFGQSDFTFSTLVFVPNPPANQSMIVLSKEQCAVQGSQLRLEVRDNMVAFGMTDRSGAWMGLWDSTLWWWNLRAPLTVGAWSHVAVTREGTVLRLYVNGDLGSTVTMQGDMDHGNDLGFLIGARHGCGAAQDAFFTGKIDQVRVYNRALAENEVAAVFSFDSSGLCRHSPVACPTDAIAWWKAEDNAQDEVGAHDSSTPFGIAYADGMVGRAFDFDGSYRRVSVADSPAFKLTHAMTLEAWVYPRAYQGFITFRGDNRGGLDTWTLDTYEPGHVKFSLIDATNGFARVQAPLALNEWQHVAATWDRATGDMKVYVNGALSAQTNTAIIPVADLDPDVAVGIGNHGGTFHQFPFNGLIDELAIYSRALAADEIAAIYIAGSAGKCPPGASPFEFAHPSFTTESCINLVGVARITNDLLRVTPAAEGVIGAAWHCEKVPGAGGFSSRFRFRITDIGGWPGLPQTGGDGFGFIVQNVGPEAIVTNVATVAMETGLETNNFCVTFNTFWNWPGSYDPEPGENFVGILVNQQWLATRDLTPFGINLSDGQVHAGEVLFDGTALSVRVDGALVLTNVASSAYSTAFDSAGFSWVGFGARGGAAWENHDILQWEYSAPARPTPQPAVLPPVITDFAPKSEMPGNLVTLTGLNFSPVAENNTVYFGAVGAPVIAASVSNLTVAVPAGSTYAPITVTVDGLVAFAAAPFQPTFAGDGSSLSAASFAPHVELGAGDGAHRSVIADLDGDGKPDLAIADVYGHTISLFRNLSTSGDLTAGSFEPRVVLPAEGGASDNPYGFAVADVDGDGKLDLLACDRIGNTISVYRNLAAPGSLSADSFAPRVNFPVGADPRYARVADLDGDGRPDIVSCNYAGDTLSLLRNLGAAGSLDASSFAPHVELPAGDGPYDVAIGDLDGDGRPDLAVVNTDAATLSLYHNQATAGTLDNNSFAPRVDLPALSGNDTIVVGDMDGDGKLDLVFGSYLSRAVSVCRNQASPGALTSDSFAQRVIFITGNWTHTVALGDLNGDARPDVASVGELDSYLSVFENLSTPGEFTSASLGFRVNFPAGWNAWGVSVGDLDLDGRPDIAFCNAYDDNVFIYRNVSPMTNPPAAPNLLVNGSFENPPGIYPYQVFFPGAGMPGWVVESGTVEITGTYWQAAEGSQSLDLNGIFEDIGTIYQDVPTLPGQAYRLRFAYAGNPEGELPKLKSATVFWDGSELAALEFDITGHTVSNLGWVYFDQIVLASNTTTRLRFQSTSPTFCGLTLDDVSLTSLNLPPSGDKPTIVSHPADSTAPAGSTASFHVSATGTAPLFYHWFKAGDSIPQATTETFELLNVQPDQEGAYFVVVSNAYGTATSSNAMLTVLTYPPTITMHPVSQSAHAGRTATFKVQAVGTAPLAYQWMKETEELPGGTNATLTLANVQASDAGWYHVVVTNAYGSVPSERAELTVLPAPVCVPAPEGVVAWWPGESNTWDIVGGFDGSVYPNPPASLLYTTGVAGSAFRFQQGLAMVVPQSPELDLGQRGSWTFEGWINVNTVTSSGTYGVFGWGGSGPGLPSSSPPGVNLRVMGPGILQLQLVKTNGQIIPVQTGPSSVQFATWQHLAVTCSNTNGEVALYVNGQPVVQTNVGTLLLRTSDILRLGNGAGPSLNGLLDEPTFYSRALSPAEIQSIYLADFAGKCPPPPPPCVTVPDIVALWRGETNTVDSVGGNHGVRIPTNYPAPLAYQTGKVDTAFSFRGQHCIVVPSSDTLDVGKADGMTIEGWVYPNPSIPAPVLEWTDSNSFGASLWLSYYRGPTVLEANLIDTAGRFHIFYSPPNSIRSSTWQHVAMTYDKLTGMAVLYVDGNAVTTTNLGSFTPKTDTQLVIGFHPRSITTGPTAPYPPPSVDRYFSGAMDELAIYRRALSGNEIRSLMSRAGRCLEFPPAIARQPQDQIALEGGAAGFEVAAGGSEPLDYQWFFDGSAIEGAKGPSLPIMPVDLADAGGYSVQVSNAFGAVTSRVATLTLLPANQCLPAPSGAVAFWRGESNTLDELGNHPADWTNTIPGYTTWQTGSGKVGTAFRFAGTSYLQVKANPDLDVGAGGGFTVEGWIKPELPAQQPIFDWNNGLGVVGVGLMYGRTGPGTLEVTLTDTNAYSTSEGVVTFSTPPWVIGSVTNPRPDWSHVALTYDKAAGKAILFVNGRSVAQRTIAPIRKRTSPQDYGPFSPTTSSDFYMGWRRSGLYSGPRYRGAMDEMTVYYRALAPLELQAIYVVGANGKCTPQPSCLPLAEGIVSWWRGESNTLDSVNGNHGSNTPPALYTNGVAGNALRYQPGRYVRIPASASLNVGASVGLTFEAWIKPDQTLHTLAAWQDYSPARRTEPGVWLGSSPTRGPAYLEADLVDTLGISHAMLSPYQAIKTGSWQHVAATYDKASGQAVLYINGSPVTVTNLGLFTPRTTGDLYLGYWPQGPYASGALDEVALYNRALSSGEITAIYRTGATRCMEPPVLVRQPESRRVNAGSDVTFSAEAVGNPVLRYQWYGGSFLAGGPWRGPLPPGQTNSWLLLTNVGRLHELPYWVVVSNAFGAVTSSPALLQVNYPPVADASATVSPVISPNNTNALVILDGSRSSDPDHDPLAYKWCSTLDSQPSTALATGVVAVVTLPVGSHALELVVDDGLLARTNPVAVEVVTPAQALVGLVASVETSPLPLALKASLRVHLVVAQWFFTRNQSLAGVVQLEVFKRRVQRWVEPLDPALAVQWITQAQAVIDVVQTGLPSGPALEQLLAVVRAAGLPWELRQALELRVREALTAASRGDTQGVAEALAQFIAEADAGLAEISPELADFLTDTARGIGADSGEAPRGRMRPEVSRESGRMQMRFGGLAGQRYLIEASTNLVDWEKIGVARETAGGGFEYEDVQSGDWPCRYYRIVTP